MIIFEKLESLIATINRTLVWELSIWKWNCFAIDTLKPVYSSGIEISIDIIVICKIISQHIIRSVTLKYFSFSTHVHNNWFCLYLPIWSIVCWVDKINHENQVPLKGWSERIFIVIAFMAHMNEKTKTEAER